MNPPLILKLYVSPSDPDNLEYLWQAESQYLPSTACGDTEDLTWLDLTNLKVKSEEAERSLVLGRCRHRLQLPGQQCKYQRSKMETI